MNKELVVLTAAFALAAGIVFAQEMKKADNVTAPAVAAGPAKAVQDMNAAGTNAQATNAETMNAQATNAETMNAQATNAETMNAQATNAETMNAEATNAETMNAEATNAETMNAEAPAPAEDAPAAAPAAEPKY